VGAASCPGNFNRSDAVFDWLVVGAGFAGAVMAERLAEGLGARVLVIDKRPHIGGNAYDKHDRAGILIHQYGPHIFHTNSTRIVDYLSRFTDWRPYEHRVLARVDGQLVPLPINLTTLNQLYGLNLANPCEVESFLKARAQPLEEIRTSEDRVVSEIGRELFEKFFSGYTLKQWGMPASQLDKSVTARVPTRTNDDDRYFTDTFQAMPLEGYTRMFERMLKHPNITVLLSSTLKDIKGRIPFRRMVYTGPIDEYFDYRFGALPYRSLRFEHVTLPRPWEQPVAVINYPQDGDYTRSTEYKHLTGQTHPFTSLSYEYPTDRGDPYYPVPRPQNQQLFKLYEELTHDEPDVAFVGRLATYRYYNMDQIVGQALSTYRRLEETFAPAPPLVSL
jgi:UDP-galactopyranose mutase